MKKHLIQYLACPKTWQDLLLMIEEECMGEIKKWTLTTTDGAFSYPIINYVPRFVGDDNYTESFSLEWAIHKKTQVDSANEKKEADGKFFRHTGFLKDELKWKLVLDVGCGVGRFMEIVNNHDWEIIGIDMSYAVDSAFENIGLRPGVHIIQADIFQLPFKQDIFDRIYSIGVLHHTPSTRRAFLWLPRFLKKWGEIIISVYTNEGIRAKCGNVLSEAIRFFTKRTSKKRLHAFCVMIAPWILSIKRLPVLRVLVAFLPVRAEYSSEYATLEIFDHLSPWYQDYHTYAEVRSWFKSAGLKNLESFPIPVSVKWVK